MGYPVVGLMSAVHRADRTRVHVAVRKQRKQMPGCTLRLADSLCVEVLVPSLHRWLAWALQKAFPTRKNGHGSALASEFRACTVSVDLLVSNKKCDQELGVDC